MKNRVTLETAITVTRYGMLPIASWPLPPGASPFSIMTYNIYWWFAITHLVTGSLGWFYNIYVNINDTIYVIRILAEVCAITTLMAKMTICKIEAPRLQRLIAEMEMFLKEVNGEELKLIQLIVDKCFYSHTTIFCCAAFGPFAYMFGPMVLEQPFPGEASYPFSYEPTWIWTLLYASHSLIVLQVGCMAILDFMFAILLWFASARFQMLVLELQRAVTDDDVKRCIRKHQALLEYADRLKLATRIMALDVTAGAIFSVTTGGFVLICNPPFFVSAKFAFFEFVAALELLLYTWPADTLTSMSEKVGEAAYSCDWIGKSPQMLKHIFIIVQRSKQPVVIHIEGILPALSLEFYGSVLSATFSYFTALRAMAANA